MADNSYNDADYVSIYGMPPEEWYARGVRLLGRTTVECTRDDLGNAIGLDTSAVVGKASNVAETLVIDPLRWLGQHLVSGYFVTCPGLAALGSNSTRRYSS